MNIQELLKYTLLDLGDYKLTVGSILAALMVFVIARIVINLIGRMLKRIGAKRGMDHGRQLAMQQLISYVIWVITVFLMLEAVGIKPTLLLASSAALLVGIGLGLQAIFSDVVSGIFLLFEGTIRVGDILEVDGMVGRVQQINLRTSLFKTRDDIIMIIPNSQFVNDRVINWSHNNIATRFSVGVGVSYNSDVEKVKQVLLQCVVENDEVITFDPNHYPLVRLIAFGNSSIDFEVLFFSKNMFRIENTLSDIRFAIRKEFIRQNIEIPFPQRDLHLRTVNPEIRFNEA